MCSITLSHDFQQQLADLGGNTKNVLKRLFNDANDADVNTSGLMDVLGNNLHSPFPLALRQAGVRKHTIGRHRVFYIGRHTDCNYQVFFLKANKKEDNWQHDDNNPVFHNHVETQFKKRDVSNLQLVKTPDGSIEMQEEESVLAVKDESWKDSSWYREHFKTTKED